jgi:hypothetical protein
MSYVKFIDIVPDPGPHHGFPPPLSISFDQAHNPARQSEGEGALWIGELKDKARFSDFSHKGIIRQSDNYKKADQQAYKIAEFYAQYTEALQIIADYEATHSNLYLYKTNVLTIRHDYVLAGQPQSDLDWHPDALRDGPLLDHIYIVSDRKGNGTLIQSAPMADAKNRLSAIQDEQSASALFIRTEPYSIYLMTNYCLHKPPTMQKTGPRAFLRMTYRSPDRKILDTLPPERRQKLGFG